MVTVASQIQSLGLPSDVEKKALEIYESMPIAVQKWRSINGKAYLCISEAYKSTKKIPELESVGKKLNVTVKKGKKMLKDAGRLGYKPVLYHYTPHEFVPKFCRYIGITSEYYDEIYRLIDFLLEASPIMHERKPQVVAGGVILYYAKYHGGYQFDIPSFTSRIKLSASVIADVRKQISVAENSSW
jgi:transcription initiation factor TFIIIB Brf1 subunit/transcription initiation factor TFIIB